MLFNNLFFVGVPPCLAKFQTILKAKGICSERNLGGEKLKDMLIVTSLTYYLNLATHYLSIY